MDRAFRNDFIHVYFPRLSPEFVIVLHLVIVYNFKLIKFIKFTSNELINVSMMYMKKGLNEIKSQLLDFGIHIFNFANCQFLYKQTTNSWEGADIQGRKKGLSGQR